MIMLQLQVRAMGDVCDLCDHGGCDTDGAGEEYEYCMLFQETLKPEDGGDTYRCVQCLRQEVYVHE